MAHGIPSGMLAGMAAATVALLGSPAAAAAAAEAPRSAPAPLMSSALSLNQFPAPGFDIDAETNQWGCWNCGWGGGWHRGGWRRRGPSAGEVLAGVAIVGGIAAIAAAATSNNRRNRDVVVVDRNRPRNVNSDWDRRNDRAQLHDRRSNPRTGGASGLDSAVNQCLATIERDVRVDGVETVQRTPQGWLVAGSLFNGSGFQCRIGNDGRIEQIDFGAGGGFGNAGDQWDDARYADARRSAGPTRPMTATSSQAIQPVDPGDYADANSPATATLAANNEQPLVPLSTDRLPAYPGGPVEGEELPPVVERPGIP